MKILILGHARHGKDELASILQKKYNLTFKSSSETCNELFIYETLRDKYNYTSKEECFEDRTNHRDEWKRLICDYNKDDKARLGKYIYERNDIYVGLRDFEEYEAIIKLGTVDVVIYVDAGKRMGYNDETMGIGIDDFRVNCVVDNNGTLEELEEKLAPLYDILNKF
jgi:hypothetical protein